MVGSRFFVEVLRHRVPDQIIGNSAPAPRREVKSALGHTHIALSTTGSVFMIRFASTEPKTNRYSMHGIAPDDLGHLVASRAKVVQNKHEPRWN
ncbi:MAG: hypothetical protein ACK4Z4_05570 [Ferrovibrio sp.]